MLFAFEGGCHPTARGGGERILHAARKHRCASAQIVVRAIVEENRAAGEREVTLG